MAEFYDPNEDDFGAELRGTVISGGGSQDHAMSVFPSSMDFDPNAAAQSVGSGLSEIMSNNQVLTVLLLLGAVYVFRARQ